MAILAIGTAPEGYLLDFVSGLFDHYGLLVLDGFFFIFLLVTFIFRSMLKPWLPIDIDCMSVFYTLHHISYSVHTVAIF